jgi:hypothetical protein
MNRRVDFARGDDPKIRHVSEVQRDVAGYARYRRILEAGNGSAYEVRPFVDVDIGKGMRPSVLRDEMQVVDWSRPQILDANERDRVRTCACSGKVGQHFISHG